MTARLRATAATHLNQCSHKKVEKAEKAVQREALYEFISIQPFRLRNKGPPPGKRYLKAQSPEGTKAVPPVTADRPIFGKAARLERQHEDYATAETKALTVRKEK